jgi:DNA replication ATP-dependent helicase Dna2
VTGATHHALRGAADGAFDVLICDEASQVRAPDALTFMCKVSGKMVFVGDTRQLGPIIHGAEPQRPMSPAASILEHMCEVMSASHVLMLEDSYRLNEALCAGPSRCWYDGALRAVHKDRRVELLPVTKHDQIDNIINPSSPLSVLVVEHRGQTSQSQGEASWVARLVARLVERGLGVGQLGVLTPHRQQSALVIEALREALGEGAALPMVETVERAQGGERDVILYSLTSSDAEHIDAGFLLDPRRTNVALTRARSKLIVLGSSLLLREHVPIDEESQRRYGQLMSCLRDASWHDAASS